MFYHKDFWSKDSELPLDLTDTGLSKSDFQSPECNWQAEIIQARQFCFLSEWLQKTVKVHLCIFIHIVLHYTVM